MSAAAPTQLDHLVVAARTLDEGVAWCEATLGVTPGPGGEHALFGTHNRLLRLDTPDAPRAYLEIIAIDPAATPARGGCLKRWFDLDDAALQHTMAEQGPQLVHWVASVPDLAAACTALRGLGIDRGPVLAASRPTPLGLLRWRITVRDDGQRLMGGTLPTLIQWGDTHPTSNMADSGLNLSAFTLRHPEPDTLRRAMAAVGLDGIAVEAGAPALHATLQTPRGTVLLGTAG
ncbi:MAG: VOC family protein [Hydrogenophaga sp.]|nr:VOC family protein [Hydrogenophaga sp.]